eukprot:scaffold520_cov708-Prasinococcus_capsulatus_cf.AAC.2
MSVAGSCRPSCCARLLCTSVAASESTPASIRGVCSAGASPSTLSRTPLTSCSHEPRLRPTRSL